MGNGTTLLFGMIFGSIGFGYFVYGKKQQKFIPMAAGVGLCSYPYFVSNVYLMIGIGVILTVLPWLIR
jgi:hypothetical protein